MTPPNLVLLYVDDPLRSAEFYERLFDLTPVASYPTYVAFQFSNGLAVGLWFVKAKNFVSGGSGHRAELAFIVPDEAQVRALRDRWRSASANIEQDLHEAVFGLTFVALDPDGHRIRVCTPDG